MKIQKGLWYLCSKNYGYFTQGNWYYSPEDRFLNGNDNKPHFVYNFHTRHFSDVQEIRIKAPKVK